MSFVIIVLGIALGSWLAIALNRRIFALGRHHRQTRRQQRGFIRTDRAPARRSPSGRDKQGTPARPKPGKGGAKGPLKKPWGW